MVSKRAVAVGIVVALLIPVGLVAFGVLGAPSLADVQNSFGVVNESETEIETDLVIHNPNPVGINLEQLTVHHQVAMNDRRMAQGELDGVVVGTGNSTITVTSWLNNSRIPAWWVSHVENGERTDVEINATVRSDRLDRNLSYTHEMTIETDILAGFRSEEVREIDPDEPLAPDPLLYVNETDASWGEVRANETPIEKRFHVYNPNTEPYVFTRLGYAITMNNVTVGTGETAREYVIPGRSREELALTTAIDATTLDEWWVRHLDEDVHGHQVSAIRMDFWAVIEFPTGQHIEVPLDALTYEDYIGTDIFDEGGNVGVPPAESPGDGSTAAGGGNTSDSTGENDTSDGNETTDDESDGNTTDEEGDSGLLGREMRSPGA